MGCWLTMVGWGLILGFSGSIMVGLVAARAWLAVVGDKRVARRKALDAVTCCRAHGFTRRRQRQRMQACQEVILVGL